MNILRTEAYRALRTPGFLAGTAGFVLCALAGAWRPLADAFLGGGTLHEPGYMLECAGACLGSRYLLLALPVLAALPYADSFVEDRQSRFLRSYLPRCGRRSFLTARTGAVALSGAAVMAAGSGVVLLVVALFLLPHEQRPDPLQIQDIEALQLVLAGDILRQVLLLTLSGGLWALVGAVIAVLGNNRHLALAAPFIVFYVLVILSTRYFPNLEALNPELWAQASGVWQDVPFAAGLLVFELSLAVSFLLTICMERNLRDV